MDFTITSARLKEVLDLAKPIAIDTAKSYKDRLARWRRNEEPEPAAPSGIQLFAESEQLRIVVDHEIGWVVLTTPSKTKATGFCSIEPREVTKIGKLLAGAKAAEIRVTYKDGKDSMRLATSGKSISVRAAYAKESTVPAAPKSVQIPSRPFIDIIEATRHAVSADETRPTFTWFRIERDGVEFRAVTTDGYRMALAVAEVKADLDNFAKSVPSKAIELFLRFLGKSNVMRVGVEAVEKKGSDQSRRDLDSVFDTVPLITLGCGTPKGSEVVIYVKEVQDPFPPYRAAIPSMEYDTNIRLAMPDALNVLVPITEILKDLARNDRMSIGIHVQHIDGQAVVWREDIRNHISVAGDLPGTSSYLGKKAASGHDPDPVGVNARYFTEALQAITSSEAAVGMNSDYGGDPILITGRHNMAHVTCAVMPIGGVGVGGSRRIARRPGPNPPTPIPVAKLADAISFVSAALDLRSPFIPFSALRVQYTHDETLRIEGTGADQWAQANLPLAGSRGSGISVISAKLLSDVVGRFPKAGSVILNVDGSSTNTEHGAVCLYDADLPIAVEIVANMAGNDYPSQPVFTPSGSTSISCSALVPLFQTVLPITGQDARYRTNLVAVNSGHGRLMVHATDNHNAIQAWTKAPNGDNFSIVVPRATVVAALKLLHGDFAGARPATFATGTIGTHDDSQPVQAGSISVPARWPGDESRSLTFRAVNTNPLDIQRVISGAINGRPAGSVDVDRRAFMSGVRLLEADSDDTDLLVTLENDAGKLRLSGSGGKNSVQLDAGLQGHIVAGFTAESLLRMAQIPSSERIAFSLHNDYKFALLRGQSSPYVSFDMVVSFARPTPDAPKWDGEITTDPLPAPPDPIEAPLTEGFGTRLPKPKAGQRRMYILDADAFEMLTKIEGGDWAAMQRKQDYDPYGFWMNLAAFKTIQEMGLDKQGYMIADALPEGGGFFGSDGAGYTILPDGEIVLLASMSTASKQKLASRYMRVV